MLYHLKQEDYDILILKEMESFMTVLDTSIPYEKVLMVMARKTIRKEIELNPKFHYVEFDESLKRSLVQATNPGLFI